MATTTTLKVFREKKGSPNIFSESAMGEGGGAEDSGQRRSEFVYNPLNISSDIRY